LTPARGGEDLTDAKFKRRLESLFLSERFLILIPGVTHITWSGLTQSGLNARAPGMSDPLVKAIRVGVQNSPKVSLCANPDHFSTKPEPDFFGVATDPRVR
jgi:hypothetical protein